MTDIVERLRESADGWFNEVGTRHEAADEIERLRAERDALADKLRVTDALYAEACAAAYDRGALLAERDALRADAERYRWLRDATDVGIMRLGNRYKTDGWSIRTAAAWYDRDTLDEAIDAALAARGKDE